MNAHQRTDKGFGPALGPAAAQAAIERFERVGYAVVQGASDWVFGPQDREIQIEILSGWAAAAREIGDLPLPDVIGWLTRRRDLVAAGRSSIRVGHVDFFARPTGHALSRQIAVEQHLVVEPVHVHRRAQRLVDTLDRRQREARPAGAEDDRRDHDMQPVETARGEEARHRVGAAFDQHPAQAALGERRKDRRRRDLPVGLGHADDLDVRTAAAAWRPRAVTTRRRTPSSARSLALGRQPSAGIDHHPRRVRAGDAPHRELRIVGERRADPDHHRIDQGAQPVQMGEPRRPVDVVRMAGFGRDPAVERLADLADHDQIVDPCRAAAGRTAPPREPAAGTVSARNASGTAVQESMS